MNTSLYQRWAICLIIIGCLASVGFAEQPSTAWRSVLYPEDWTPEFVDSEGRFLHDFSFAGYHAGEKPLPDTTQGHRIDVTKPPYNADPTGKQSSTSAIQRAINDAGNQGGGTVYLPEGKYRLKYQIEGLPMVLMIAHSNVIIQGDGTDRTFLFFDETVTRGKTMIKVEPISGMNWTVPRDDDVQFIQSDVSVRDTVIHLTEPPLFTVGEWVVIQFDPTPEWIAEHNMSDGWDSSIGGIPFFRQITAVNRDQKTITVDVPLRYDVKVRDHARVFRVHEPLTEVGLADFSFGMREHPDRDGWGFDDHGRFGTGAYDVHGSVAISFNGVVNGWMRDVSTYKPESNESVHFHSIAYTFKQSRFLTIRRVTGETPQYARAGGGNGYTFVIETQESLYDHLTAVDSGNAFTFTRQWTSGNVIYRGETIRSVSGSASNFHMRLSMANLIDNLTYNEDRFEAGDRSHAAGVSGFPKHGVTTTQTVFWNNSGLAYRQDRQYIIRSDQYGWGYIIGTKGPAPNILANTGNERTMPTDFVEGVGAGDTLIPQSLYVDQLRKRLSREGKESNWEQIRGDLISTSSGDFSGKIVLFNADEIAELHIFLGPDEIRPRADGSFEIRDLPYGQYPLTILKGDVELHSQDVHVLQPRTSITVDLRIIQEWTPHTGTWTTATRPEGNVEIINSDTILSNTNAYTEIEQRGDLIQVEWTVDYRSTEGSSSGMHIMADNATASNRGNSYLIFQNAPRITLYKSEDNAMTSVATFPAPAIRGGTHRYRVRLNTESGHMSIYRDGQLVGEWIDEAPLKSGAFVSVRTNKTNAAFYDVKVTSEQ